MEQITLPRDYTTLSVSQVDHDIAAFTLRLGVEDEPSFVEICKTNLDSLEKFIASYPDQLRWVKPTSASMAFVCIVNIHWSATG